MNKASEGDIHGLCRAKEARDAKKLAIYESALQETADLGCAAVRESDRPCKKCYSCAADRALKIASKERP